MYFKQILDERCGCASYVLASRETMEAAIVDPGIDLEPYRVLLHDRGFKLRYLIDTHVHADHVSGARKMAALAGGEVCLHESARVAYPFRPLKDGEELPLGQLRLRILHTPGHRPELVSVLVVNPTRSSQPSMVLTGDCLLVGDVGRPDFGGGDANHQWESVGRLLRLPDWVAVFPGHFEGPCGKGMCGRPSTTIGFERLFNGMTSLEREPFVASLTRGIPARPLNMVAIEATNRGVVDLPWAMLTSSPMVGEVSVAEMMERPEEVLLLDVREPEEFEATHVPGSVNLPQAELASRLDELPRERPIWTLCQAGFRSLRSAQFLKQCGFRQVRSVTGGVSAWSQSGTPCGGRATALAGAARAQEGLWTHAGTGYYEI